MVKVKEDISGNKYGRLTVIKQSEEDYIKPNGKREALWICKCECGNFTTLIKHKLTSGHTKSCGCFARESAIKKLESIDKRYNNKKYNTYDLSGEYGIGYTTNTNKPFYFDLEDYDLIKDNAWYEDNHGYAISRNINKIGKSANIKMHKLIGNNIGEDTIVDHINHNTLDNRRVNLRIVTRSENQANMKRRTDNTSGVTGVYYDKRGDRWSASIQFNHNVIYLGSSKNKEEAIKMRKDAEEKYFGEYSYSNSMEISNKKEEQGLDN